MGLRLVLAVAVLICACRAAMILESPEFRNFELIPPNYGCEEVYRDHRVASPPLSWVRVPAKTQSFVLMVEDVEDDANGFVNWIVKNIPRDIDHLPADASILDMPESAVELPNSYRESMWGGFCPPPKSTHLYRFRLYARATNETLLIAPPADSGIPITAEMYDAQLKADHQTIYCAVLVGKFHVGEYLGPPPAPRPYRPPVKVDLMPVARYPKPSESLKHTRKHANPRPYGDAPYNATEMCLRRTHKKISEEEYSQICNVTRVDIPVEEGGAEEPIMDMVPDRNPLLKSTGVHSRWYDIHRKEDPTPWQLDSSGIPRPPAPEGEEHSTANARARANLIASQQTTTLASTGDTQNIPEPSSVATGRSVSLLDDEEALVVWECADPTDRSRNASVLVRSPFWDSCSMEGKETAGQLPTEFACDAGDAAGLAARFEGSRTEETVASPTVLWRLADRRRVGSVVVMVEDVATSKIHWLVKDIPAKSHSLPLGASGTRALLNGAVEMTNSFGVAGYSSPCNTPPASAPEIDTHAYQRPILLRFHVFTRPDTTTAIPAKLVGNGRLLTAMLSSDALAHGTMDVVLPARK